MWYLHAMEYHSALKRSEILTHAIISVNFEDITLDEISQSQEQIRYDSTFMRCLESPDL